MLERVHTEMRQGHCIKRVGGGLVIVNAKGFIKDKTGLANEGEAIDLLLSRRATWLEGYFACSDEFANASKEIAVA